MLAAKEVNNLVKRVEVIPRKPVPRQGRRTDAGATTSYGDDNRNSTTSTISTVDAFCREYRPPSVELHRLSYLNKELPPPPTSETPKKTLSQDDKTLSRIPTQKNAAVQTTISIQSRYSTRIKPATRSRLSHVLFQQRDLDDRLSIRSHFSTHEFPVDRDALRSERRSSVATDRRGPSVVTNPSTDKAKRPRSRSISPGTVPPHDEILPLASREIKDPRRRGTKTEKTDQRPSQETKDCLINRDSKEMMLKTTPKHRRPKTESDSRPSLEIQDPLASTEHKEIVLESTPNRQGSQTDPQASQEAQDPLLPSTKSKEIILRSISSKPKVSVGWTFSDGFLLRTQDGFKNTTESGMGERGKNIALHPVSMSMIPIRWTFNDGIIFKSIKVPRNDDDLSAVKSKRWVPIGWSFYDGFTIRHDSSVTNVEEANTGESEDGSKSKRMIPIGWSFYDGFTIRPDGSVTHIEKATGGGSEEIVQHDGSKVKRKNSVGWNFHDGFTIRPDGSVTHVERTSGESEEIVRHDGSKSKRIISIGWNFHDGFTIRPDGSVTHVKRASGENEIVPHDGIKSKRINPISWNFHDGFTIKSTDDTVKYVSPAPGGDSDEAVARADKSKRLIPIGWTFHEGLIFAPTNESDKNAPDSADQSNGSEVEAGSKRLPISWNFYDGLLLSQN